MSSVLSSINHAFPIDVVKVTIRQFTADSKMATSTNPNNIMHMSKDDFRKKKELDEARKAGKAPAEVDEEGK